MFFFSILQNISKGKLLQLKNDISIDHLLIDSRKLVLTPGAMFFAIKGKRHDGHKYLAEVYEKGIRNLIISNPQYLVTLPKANIFLVENPILALQHIAAFKRKHFHIPVIGITGSNGKTIVKEWLTTMLQRKIKVIKNPKSYNSQTGVPLSVWGMSKHHEIAVFEAGISKMGEMEQLSQVIQPSIGLLTNIGPAHDEGFPSKKRKSY